MRSDIQTADIPIGSINCTIWVTEPNPTEVLFGVDAFSEGHVSQSDLHNSTTSNSLTSQHCATFLIEFVQCLREHVMRETQGYIDDGKRYGFRYLTSTSTSPFALSMIA